MGASSPDEESASLTTTAYGSFLARFRAMVLDSIVVMSLFLTILFSASAVDIAMAGRLAVLALVALVLLYEPLLVSRFGATLGHRWSNLHVVSERTGGHPAFWAAFVRFIVKSVLGLPSFIFMAFTRRHQALHDRIAGTTVRIRDLSRAGDHDVAWERSDSELAPPGIPSLGRRVLVITLYVLASFIGLSLFSAVLVSRDCLATEICTESEELRATVAGAAWLALVAFCVIAGWRGYLWGARRRRDVGGSERNPSAEAE